MGWLRLRGGGGIYLGDVGVFGEVTDSEHELRRRILQVGRAVGTLPYT